jgi:hypothetical protein
MKFLILTLTDWDEPPRARHQVARALARHGDVIFISRNKKGIPRVSERVVEDGITLIEPTWPVDYRFRYRLPGINELYLVWLLNHLRERYPDAQVITFDHSAGILNRYFPDYIYVCNDDMIGNSSISFKLADQYHRHTEKQVASHAKAIVATSQYLVDKLLSLNPNTHEMLLGAPTVTDSQLADFPKREKRNGPHIGLVGFIGRRTPKSLLIQLLEIKGSTLSLVGPIEAGFMEGFSGQDRVCATGVITGEKLARIIAGFDVAIAPYNLDFINKGGTPNKLWQYLAVGRPAVVTKLPNMANWSFPDGCVYVAEDESDFVKLVRQAYAEDSEELVARRISVARENTWDKKIKYLLGLMS